MYARQALAERVDNPDEFLMTEPPRKGNIWLVQFYHPQLRREQKWPHTWNVRIGTEEKEIIATVTPPK